MEVAFQIGLDEAGYGPLLGPLTIGAVRIDGPRGALRRVIDRRSADVPKIADSKTLFSGGNGFEALERVALAALGVARGTTPRRVAELFDGAVEGLAEHPWYGALDAPLPRKAAPERVAAATEALDHAIRSEDAKLARASVRPRLEGALNASFERTGCKGATHLEHMGDAMIDVLRDAPDRNGVVVCDRLGGRKFYAAFLRDLFPFRPIDVVEENNDLSRYVVRPREAPLDVSFVVGGEAAAPEVALASCLAKYARETLMEAFNTFFAAEAPGLAPTAGYYEDGRRFLDELAAKSGDPTWGARLSRRR